MTALTLYLRQNERTFFDAFPKELQNGWSVQEENINITEAPEQRRMRMMLLKLRDPKLQKFVDSAKNVTDVDALADLIVGMDLSGVNDADLSELFFTFGPTAVGVCIFNLLQEVKTDDDIENIAVLCEIRHSLLVSMQTV